MPYEFRRRKWYRWLGIVFEGALDWSPVCDEAPDGLALAGAPQPR